MDKLPCGSKSSGNTFLDEMISEPEQVFVHFTCDKRVNSLYHAELMLITIIS